MPILNYINQLVIPDLWQLLLGALVALGLVYLVEWLRTPKVKIVLDSPVITPNGRKIVKVRVEVYSPFEKRFFPWKYSLSPAKLRAEVFTVFGGREVVLGRYQPKWDTSPEPWDYARNRPRPELIPAAMSPENLVVEDKVGVGVAVKHPSDSHFYLFDADYYMGMGKQVNEKMVFVRIGLVSSVVSKHKTFLIYNPGTDLDDFDLKEAS